MTDSGVAPLPGKVRVWDPAVRLFHWSLVLAFTVAWLSSEGFDQVHEIAGYVVAALVAFRMVWGVVGTRYARFTQFLCRPSVTRAYLADVVGRRERRYLGHNPAGAAMIVALLVTLSGTALTGWLIQDPKRMALLPDLPQIVAPAFADDDGEARNGKGDGGLIKDLHELLANLMLLLVALHVAGVILASVGHRENLVRAMVTGDKRAAGPGDVT